MLLYTHGLQLHVNQRDTLVRPPWRTVLALMRIMLRMPVDGRTVPLFNSKLFIIRYCLILVWTTVMGRPRQVDTKNGVKNYQGPITSQENTIFRF